MKQKDVKYYADQINSFTPCEAVEKKNRITIVFPNEKKKTVSTENEANEIYLKCSNQQPPRLRSGHKGEAK